MDFNFFSNMGKHPEGFKHGRKVPVEKIKEDGSDSIEEQVKQEIKPETEDKPEISSKILSEEVHEDKFPVSGVEQPRAFVNEEEMTLKGIIPPVDERIIKSKPQEDERIIKTQPQEDERILKVTKPAKEEIIEKVPERYEPKEKPITQEEITHEKTFVELEESRKTYLELHKQLEELRSEGYKLTTSTATFGGGGIDTKKVFENEALKESVEAKMKEALKVYESVVAKIAKGEYMARMEKLPTGANESEEERKIRGEISKKYFIDERDSLKNIEKENKQKDSPIFLKALQKFGRLPKWARYIASAAIATGFAVTGGAAIGGFAIGSSVALTLGFGTYKVGRAYLASFAVVGTERLGSLAIKKHLEGYKERKIGELEGTGGDFINNIEETRAKYEKAMKDVERRGKWLNLAKWLTAIGVGGSTMLLGGAAEHVAGFTKPQFESLGTDKISVEKPEYDIPEGPIDITPPGPSHDYGWGIRESVPAPKAELGNYPYTPGEETPHSNFRFPGEQGAGNGGGVIEYPPSHEGVGPDTLGRGPALGDSGKVVFPPDSSMKATPPESLRVGWLGPDSLGYKPHAPSSPEDFGGNRVIAEGDHKGAGGVGPAVEHSDGKGSPTEGVGGEKLITEQEEIRKLAAVRKGEGIWNPVRRQFEHLIEQKQKIGAANLSAEDINELKKLGIKPEDLNDVEKVRRGINRATYNLLVERKFIDPDNVEEIRVSTKGIGKEIFIDEYKGIGKAKSILDGEHTYGWHPEMETKPKIEVPVSKISPEVPNNLPTGDVGIKFKFPNVVPPNAVEYNFIKSPTPTVEWANEHGKLLGKALKDIDAKDVLRKFQESSLAEQEKQLNGLSRLANDVTTYKAVLKEQYRHGWKAPDKMALAEKIMKRIDKLEKIHYEYERSYAGLIKNKLGLSSLEYKKTMVTPLYGEQPTVKGILNLYNENPKIFDPKFLKMARFLKKVVGTGKKISDTMKVDELIQKVAEKSR